ncbi:MAG: undecaprenyl-diphosphate phosphatase [Planctomycetota bacterium]|nr:MAG: undecaprenyl-diphosphate phosphatase [Planctomycetota bacterium]RLS52321.1 MAG: undecaprenyl-diphosphate phosphatase [Planctomycetota bacterium]
MTLFDAVILGLVEGITEYLPVSSTGHLLLIAQWLGLRSDEEQRRAVDAFSIVIQGGAILAVAGLYWSKVRGMAHACVAVTGLVRKAADHRQALRLLRNLVAAFIPAAIFGLLLDDWLEARLFKPLPVVLALAIGGVALVLLDKWVRERAADERGTEVDGSSLTVVQSVLIGLMQCVAMWPGTSRSMMSILGGLSVGLRPRAAAEFSFLLGLPTLGAACAYSLLKLLRQDGGIELLGGVMPVAVGIIVAAVSAAFAISWLVAFIGRGGFLWCGLWRILLAALVGWMLWSGRLAF